MMLGKKYGRNEKDCVCHRNKNCTRRSANKSVSVMASAMHTFLFFLVASRVPASVPAIIEVPVTDFVVEDCLNDLRSVITGGGKVYRGRPFVR
jgi:hypothetical protein